MQMEFLKMDKERENPPEELQSRLLSVCLSAYLYVRERMSLCTPLHVYIYMCTSSPTHTPPPILTGIVDFTDEEGYGKYLDLHQCYDCYINLKQLEVSQPDYMCCVLISNKSST